jgi:hypothetical protein
MKNIKILNIIEGTNLVRVEIDHAISIMDKGKANKLKEDLK